MTVNMGDRHRLYRDRVLAALPRVLTELDRDPLSSTWGSFDREYWAWSTKDFSNIDLQRAVYPLTVLYLQPMEGNWCQGQPRVRQWISGVLQFWGRSQHRNGSFDHHYPNEFSFVGTAFPLFEMAEAFRLLDEAGELSAAERKEWLATMTRAGDFLCRSDEWHGFISNHRVGAACGLALLAHLTQEERYRRRARHFIDTVREQFCGSEGWLNEYGGADPGYQTLDTYYLANYWRLTGDEEFYARVVEPSVGFLAYFFHPDGSVGGEHGSRNCPLYFPSGFELLARTMPAAEAIAALAAEGIRRGATPALGDMDIRNFVPMLSSYTQAMLASSSGTTAQPAELPIEREFERYWPEAGLFVRSDHRHYIVVGCAKGGVVKVFSKAGGGLVASHAGYMLETSAGRRFSNQFLAAPQVDGLEDCTGREAPVRPSRMLRLRHPFFFVVRHRVFTPWRFLFFRLFALTIGRHLWLANWIKRRVITGWFIHRRRQAPIWLKRCICLDPELTIEDEFEGVRADTLKALTAGDFFTTIYMASSKYYRQGESLPEALNAVDLAAAVRRHGPRLSYRLAEDGLRLDARDSGVVAAEPGGDGGVRREDRSCAASSAG